MAFIRFAITPKDFALELFQLREEVLAVAHEEPSLVLLNDLLTRSVSPDVEGIAPLARASDIYIVLGNLAVNYRVFRIHEMGSHTKSGYSQIRHGQLLLWRSGVQ